MRYRFLARRTGLTDVTETLELGRVNLGGMTLDSGPRRTNCRTPDLAPLTSPRKKMDITAKKKLGDDVAW